MIKVARYLVRLADGKSATVIDTQGDPLDVIKASICAQFSRRGYVLEVVKC
jgi:hypothetical protein